MSLVGRGLLGLGVVVVGILLLPACQSAHPRRDPTGEPFPMVQGEGLDGRAWSLPADLKGAPAVLLVGYRQEAQFDADRWLLGLLQADLGVKVLEVPTIEGLLPGLFAGQIDGGMRGGIPPEDWASVVTVYGDAEAVGRLTGTEETSNMRVLLLDGEGRVVWFHDAGYSARELLEMAEVLKGLKAG